MENTTATSRKNNNLLPRNIIFVRTRPGFEATVKNYAPQRWIKSISKSGELTYTTDPRMARRFKTNAQAVAICERYAVAMAIELLTDTLRWTDPSDDCGFTYFGYHDGKTGLNHDLYSGTPVEIPESIIRMRALLEGK